jgi:hypothetical protein
MPEELKPAESGLRQVGEYQEKGGKGGDYIRRVSRVSRVSRVPLLLRGVKNNRNE